MPELTQTQFTATFTIMKDVANEPIRVRFFANAFWMFGSELACRRVEYHYRNAKQDKSFGWSVSYGSWYFMLDMPEFSGDYDAKSL